MKTKGINIWWLLKVNLVCSLLVWFISRFNLFLINSELKKEIYLVSSSVIYTILILGIAYAYKNNKKLNLLVFGIIMAIYTINLGLSLSLISPLCNRSLELTTVYTVVFLFIIVFISYLTLRLNYKLCNSYKLVILFIVLGLIHFICTSFSYHLNYIVFYEFIFNSVF